MSCLNLIRLPPAKKAWKSFTTKLQTKLHKLHKSKAIKKQKQYHQPNYIFPAKASTSSSILLKKRNKNRRSGSFVISSVYKTLTFKKRHSSSLLRFRKRSAAPVYVDKLFRDPPVAEVMVAKFPPSGKSAKLIEQQGVSSSTAAAGTSREGGEEKGADQRGGCSAAAAADEDDMWESLGFASPQLQGIDERAEQFISSFRADMEIQEMIARGL
ncbi:hypothetical protein Tsubulata_011146 [Turnera subulata]|uniref:Uncharacterized protein n=1 Tax=Turnera subulata TaxID=218843 RepID=A0A9Q0FUV8_9ROSI|nr:hypothetical protein Tsubulata_011146 [Turnera subulata]